MWVNPLMLVWIVGAAMPLLVHLLSQSRYRAVDWGAMMFLPGAVGAYPSGPRLKQWALLLIRSTMVGLLAVALARPVLAGRYATAIPTAGLTTGGRATIVIILDDSASMGYTLNGKPRLDQARAVTLQILTGLKRGDQAALLLAGVPQSQSLVIPDNDLEPIASRVGELSAGTGEADFADALNRAAAILDHADTTEREIYVVCDRQALSWRRVLDASFTDSWSNRRSAGTAPRVTVFPVGGDESDNVSVESLSVLNGPIIRDQPAVLEIHVRNLGVTAAEAVPLAVWSGRRTLADLTITVPAMTTRVARAIVGFPEAGSFLVSAAVKTTGLTYDDRMDRSVDVIDPIPVLLVNKDIADGPKDLPQTPFLQLALAPYATSNRPGSDPTAVTVTSCAHWTNEPLSHFRVVILNDVSFLTTDQVRSIEQFVYEGGGVWFVPGSRQNFDQFNQLLFRAGAGIFPAAEAAPAKANLSLSFIDRQHPIFRFQGNAPLPPLHIRRIVPITTRASDAKVLSNYSSGQPFLLETTAGRGRVLMSTTAFDDDWSDIQRTPFFLPFAQSIVRYLTANSMEDRNLFTNQPIIVSLNGTIDKSPPMVLITPGPRREPATVRRFEDRAEIQFNHTDTAGTYRLRFRANGSEKAVNFVVSGSRAESDLSPMTLQQWRTIERRTGINRVEPTPDSIAEAANRQRGGREVWIDLLACVVVLSIAEVGFARWWSSGVPNR